MQIIEQNASTARGMGVDRQRIPTVWLYALLGLGVAPFVLMGLRLAGLSAVGPGALVGMGNWLNQHLNMQWVAFADRDVVLYILQLPLAALLIAIVRLTLGIRVLGFRSILIAVGMQEIGLLPCLLLILLIAASVIVIRPSLRRSGMPLFARVAIVLCIVAFVMLSGLLAGAALDSPTLWSMAFFPVVILAMLAESVADTVAKDGLVMGLWRTTVTIALAGLIALLQQFTPLRELLLSCPELLLTPLAMIVVVSEFLDLRLFQDYRPFDKQRTATTPGKPQIVLVRNRFPDAPPRRLAFDAPRRYRKASLQSLIDQLRARAYDVQILECDASLPERLRSLAKAAYAPDGKGLCVINYSGGTQGLCRMAHVPVFCEALGIPHTGPLADAPVLWPDRTRQLAVLREQGLATPEVLSMEAAERMIAADQGPLWVRPRYQSDHGATRVRSIQQLARSMQRLSARYGECLIERAPDGAALTVILQNPERGLAARALPLLQRTTGRQPFTAMPPLSEALASAVDHCAKHAACALGCRDSARVDLYLTDSGEITVTRVSAIDPPAARSATVAAAQLAQLTAADLVEHAVHSALARATTDSRDVATFTAQDSSQVQPSNRSDSPCNIFASSVTM
jgi:D-alanine-D-alanine ligase-like ATP-grasp enzyme